MTLSDLNPDFWVMEVYRFPRRFVCAAYVRSVCDS